MWEALVKNSAPFQLFALCLRWQWLPVPVNLFQRHLRCVDHNLICFPSVGIPIFRSFLLLGQKTRLFAPFVGDLGCFKSPGYHCQINFSIAYRHVVELKSLLASVFQPTGDSFGGYHLLVHSPLPLVPEDLGSE